jgi:hypothetical protein
MLLRAVLTQHGDQLGVRAGRADGSGRSWVRRSPACHRPCQESPGSREPQRRGRCRTNEAQALTATHAGGCDQRERVAVPQSVGTEQELGHVDSAGVLCLLAGDARTFDSRCGVLGQQAVTDRASPARKTVYTWRMVASDNARTGAPSAILATLVVNLAEQFQMAIAVARWRHRWASRGISRGSRRCHDGRSLPPSRCPLHGEIKD